MGGVSWLQEQQHANQTVDNSLLTPLTMRITFKKFHLSWAVCHAVKCWQLKTDVALNIGKSLNLSNITDI